MADRSIALLSCLFVVVSCGAPPPPPVATPQPSSSGVAGDSGVSGGSSKPTTSSELGPLVRLGLLEDHVGFVDYEVLPDGTKDFGFRVRISGEVLGITLTSSDAKGNPIPGACWDTYVGATPMPKVLGLGAATGGETAVLAVLDAQGMVLNPKGTLPAHEFHDELMTLWCPDPGGVHFHEGRTFTLLVLRPGNRVDRSTVVLV